MRPDPYLIHVDDWTNPYGPYGPQLPDYGTSDYHAWRKRWAESRPW